MPKVQKPRLSNRNWEMDFLFLKENDSARCIVCNVLIKRIKLYNLTRHYNRFHLEKYKGYSEEDKLQLLETYKKQKLKANENSNTDNPTTSSVGVENNGKCIDNEKCIAASYAVAWEIGRSKKYFTNVNFIKTCAIAMAKAFDNKSVIKQFKKVPLSRQTISRRYTDINKYLLEKLRTLIQSCAYYSISLDKSTDTTDGAQLAIFIRVVQSDFTLNEELLGLVTLSDAAKDIDIFTALKKEVEKFTDFNKCTCIVLGRAPNMSDKGLSKLLVLNSIHCPLFHCIIHQQVLCAKSIKLSSIMKMVTKVTNLIRGGNRSGTHRKLKTFLQSKNVAYDDLLLRKQNRWLSAGNLLQRFFAIRKELTEFLESEFKSKTVDITTELRSSEFLCGLAFLTDVTFHFNELNLKLQGKKQNIAHLFGNIEGFRKKLELFSHQLEKGNLFHFPCCKEIEGEMPEANFSLYRGNILQVLREFDNQFHDFDVVKKDIMLYMDTMNVSIPDQEVEFQLELCDLHADPFFMLKKEIGEDLFKLLSPDKYPNLRNFGLKMTSMFASTYVCKTSFTTIKVIKCNNRSKLNDPALTNALRIATTELNINIPELVKKD